VRALIASILVALAAPTLAQSAPEARPITLGTSHQIASKELGELRTVNVVLPPSYGREAARRYPVLYLIDGGVEQDLLHVAGLAQLGGIWGRSTEAIVVGVETKDRRKELVAPTKDPELLKRYPTAGGSAAFRSFIRSEVMPLVERSYRTSGHDIVLGESLAGLFILETFLEEPALFDGYAAIDPSLWWDKEALSKTAAAKLGQRQKGRSLYLAAGNEGGEMRSGIDRFVGALRSKAAAWCFAARPDLTHATIYQQLAPQALQYLLPPADAPPSEFGFEVKCSQKS
jgi:predicted alpha/beta superfamily hydrolase